MKKEAVGVLETAFYKFKAERSEPDNIFKLLNCIRDFRGNVLQFESTAKTVRSFYTGSNEIGKLSNLLQRENEMMKDMLSDQSSLARLTEKTERLMSTLKGYDKAQKKKYENLLSI